MRGSKYGGEWRARALIRGPRCARNLVGTRGRTRAPYQNARDLQRAGVRDARAVFLFPDRHEHSVLEADQQNVMRTWAVHHFNPKCPIYVMTIMPAALVRFACGQPYDAWRGDRH